MERLLGQRDIANPSPNKNQKSERGGRKKRMNLLGVSLGRGGDVSGGVPKRLPGLSWEKGHRWDPRFCEQRL